MAAVVDQLLEDARAVAAQCCQRAGVVVGLHRDVLDAEMLIMFLRVDYGRDVKLQAVQIELQTAAGDLALHGGAEIVDVELRGLLRVLGLDVDVPDFHGHARLLRIGVVLASLTRRFEAWQDGIANSTAAATAIATLRHPGDGRDQFLRFPPLPELAQASNRDANSGTLHDRGTQTRRPESTARPPVPLSSG